jgi:hypothetical protein
MNFLNEYPQIYFDEIIIFIADEFDLEISRNIISKIFKYIKIIYKRVKPVHDMQNNDLRVKWINIICNYSAD